MNLFKKIFKNKKDVDPCGYNEIGWSTVRQLEKMVMFNSSQCCATGTCVAI